MKKINIKVLMSGADYFNDQFAINSHMDDSVPVDVNKAISEHQQIRECFEKAGIEVVKVEAPVDCQDAVYAANWGLVRGDKVVMSNLPNKRQAEEDYAKQMLVNQEKTIVNLPKELAFSGQGDALACGETLFIGSYYRTSPEAHTIISKELGFKVIGLQTVPEYDENKQPVTNPVTGWPDSFFYDLDLALAIIQGPSESQCEHDNEVEICQCSGVIAWCPDAFMPESQEKIRNLQSFGKIEVSLEEAMNGFACNLVSTGESVIMSDHAPVLQKTLEGMGLTVYTPHVTELLKGGGFIRCTSLTLQ